MSDGNRCGLKSRANKLTRWPDRLRNDLYCVEWGVKLYSLTHSRSEFGNEFQTIGEKKHENGLRTSK